MKKRSKVLAGAAAGLVGVAMFGATFSSGALGAWNTYTVNPIEAKAAGYGFTQTLMSQQSGGTIIGAPVKSSSNGTSTVQLADMFSILAPNENSMTYLNIHSDSTLLQTFGVRHQFDVYDTNGVKVTDQTAINTILSGIHITIYGLVNNNTWSQQIDGSALSLNGYMQSINNSGGGILPISPNDDLMLTFETVINDVPVEYAGYSVKGSIDIFGSTI